MKPFRYTLHAGKPESGDGFALMLNIVFASRPDAREFGEQLNAFIEAKVLQAGGQLKHAVPPLPHLIPGNLVFLPGNGKVA